MQTSVSPLFDAELIRRYDVQGPRYTSYPTALQFSNLFGTQEYLDCVQDSNANPIPAPLSIYIHIPFCRSVCYFCACTKVITANQNHAADYLRRLFVEIERQAGLFDSDRRVEQLHWGGGSPTFLSMRQMQDLMQHTAQCFNFAHQAEGEYGIEIDPRAADTSLLAFLRELGLNRVSLGIQDFDPAVQQAVNRIQSQRQTLDLIDAARREGFRSVSVDLIYGLPRQSAAGFSRTLDAVMGARPDRISVFNYAHLPTRFKAQRQILEYELPPPAEKIAILQLAIERLTGAGYRYIGMDHFALEGDELSRAQDSGTLTRNFQGYSTHGECDLIGLGMSSISRIADCYSQNARDLREYFDRIDGGDLAVARGVKLTLEDQLCRDIIMSLICNWRLEIPPLETRYRFNFWKEFDNCRVALRSLERDGLIGVAPERIVVLPAGRLFLRNICMIFDQYVPRGAAPAGHSRVL